MAKKTDSGGAKKSKTPAKTTKGSLVKVSPFTLSGILSELKGMRNETMYAHNLKYGAGENQFGVKLGDIRVLAKKIKTNHDLALSLWETSNVDAQFLAILLMDPKKLSASALEALVLAGTFVHVADWLHSYVVKVHADKESLRQKWMTTKEKMTARAGWRLTAGRVAKDPEGLDLSALLDRIESEMGTAVPEVQWTMNACLAEIGIHFPKQRKRAIAIGEKLGVFRDYPCSKGCTSPFAPIWINEMVRRQG
jgi:3-methyladenine DNA glycosylase AlkD